MSAVFVLLCQVKIWIQTKNLFLSYAYVNKLKKKSLKKIDHLSINNLHKVNDWYSYISISIVLPSVTCKSGLHILEVLLLSKENDQWKF